MRKIFCKITKKICDNVDNEIEVKDIKE